MTSSIHIVFGWSERPIKEDEIKQGLGQCIVEFTWGLSTWQVFNWHFLNRSKTCTPDKPVCLCIINLFVLLEASTEEWHDYFPFYQPKKKRKSGWAIGCQ